jgi:hypothetical protein
MASAAVATAEASRVPTTAKASRMATAKGFVMPVAKVMVLPGMMEGETRRIASSIDRPSIGVRGVAIASIAIVTICWCASAQPEAE